MPLVRFFPNCYSWWKFLKHKGRHKSGWLRHVVHWYLFFFISHPSNKVHITFVVCLSFQLGWSILDNDYHCVYFDQPLSIKIKMSFSKNRLDQVKFKLKERFSTTSFIKKVEEHICCLSIWFSYTTISSSHCMIIICSHYVFVVIPN